MKRLLPVLTFVFLSAATTNLWSQSVARLWNEALIQSIREDFARPPVHARNLFHVSLALYDAWAAYDTVAETYLLGKTVAGYTCEFNGVPVPADIEAAREMAMSYAAYRVLRNRFIGSPNAVNALTRYDNLMISLGYNINYNGTNYASGNPADLGNYLGACIILMGYQDGSNQQYNYSSQYYYPVNPPLVMDSPGDPNILDPNRWQPLQLSTAIDQNGNPIPSVQVAQSPEWGNVAPFAMTEADRTSYERNGNTYYVYHDPGPFPTLDTADGGGMSDEYRWNFELVSAWGAHLTPDDSVMWDISPRGFGNNQSYPQTLAELHDFYDFENGGDHSPGRVMNPITGQPYEPQIVPRGDYTRVLAQFWADGPNSETPPGHWFAILNYVMDQPGFEKRFNGKGPILPDLEWDVKAYFALGGAVHDAAISAWGVKGWYDGVRPVSALRYMAGKGQSSDPELPSFDPAGITLRPGLIELIQPGDPLAGFANFNVGKIKVYTWRGPQTITDPTTETAGVGWILADNWWPFQRKTFVTPPFPGYISGHSTYSRAAAEVMTLITGSEYFPGGLGEFHVTANSNFLGLEKGPSVDVTLQWATYRDASDQTSLSRIWGGIHPPMDDIPGRLVGMEVGQDAFHHAREIYYPDADGDGFYSYEDCDDHNPLLNPGATEVCDGIDNNCDGLVDDLTIFSYYVDADGDGFGDAAAASLDTCLSAAPTGYVNNNVDCDDNNAQLNPDAVETCDGIDNDCNGLVDDLTMYSYYLDQDGDGFGDANLELDTCLSVAPGGYVENNQDCDDNNAQLNPGAAEMCDGIDNDCNGLVDDLPIFAYFQDADGDGFGNASLELDTCLSVAPGGYVDNNQDCDDSDPELNPGAGEICDGLDNNCNGMADEDLAVFTYFADTDGDSFGNESVTLSSCEVNPPAGYAVEGQDCDDNNAFVYPGAPELIDNLDNDCDGLIDETIGTNEPGNALFKVYPNPFGDLLYIENQGQKGDFIVSVFSADGVLVVGSEWDDGKTVQTLDFSAQAPGLYFIQLLNVATGQKAVMKVAHLH